MDIDEYEYQYEYELPSYSTSPRRFNRVEIDYNIEQLRNPGIPDQSTPESVLDLFDPDRIEIYLDIKTDSLKKQYFDGQAWCRDRRYRLDFYPSLPDYRDITPGGDTKTQIVYWLDEIRTTGRLENSPAMLNSCPGRIGWAISNDKTIHSSNIGAILMPGKNTQYQLLWFENGQPSKIIPLNKTGKKLYKNTH